MDQNEKLTYRVARVTRQFNAEKKSRLHIHKTDHKLKSNNSMKLPWYFLSSLWVDEKTSSTVSDTEGSFPDALPDTSLVKNSNYVWWDLITDFISKWENFKPETTRVRIRDVQWRTPATSTEAMCQCPTAQTELYLVEKMEKSSKRAVGGIQRTASVRWTEDAG